MWKYRCAQVLLEMAEMYRKWIGLKILILSIGMLLIGNQETGAGIATISNSGGKSGVYNGSDLQRLKFQIGGTADSVSFDSVKLTASGSDWNGSLTFGISLANTGTTNIFATKTFSNTSVSTTGTIFDLQSFNRNFATNTAYWLTVTPISTNSGALITNSGAFSAINDPSVFTNITSGSGLGSLGIWDYAGVSDTPPYPPTGPLAVEFTASVPETGTLILFGSAALAGGIAAWNKKRRKNFLGSEPVLKTTI